LLEGKKPVYIQMPSNISYLMVDAPDTKLELKLPQSDPERLESAAKHIAGLLNQARQPALLVDIEVDRSGIEKELALLINKRQIPYAELRTGKALLSEAHPLFFGCLQ
jgi:indolepyruvate decarboxylase